MTVKKIWKIYLHINKLNHKCYVGQTCRKYVKTRWQNGEGYFCSTKFYNAIKKYGWNNFEHIILEDNITTPEMADEKERYYIKEYDSIKNGYNIKDGGNLGRNKDLCKSVVKLDMVSGDVLDVYESVCDATDALNGNHSASPISRCCLNKCNSAYGFYWCYECDLDTFKVRNTRYDRKSQYKKIYQFDRDNNFISYYESITDASKSTDIAKQNIIDCAKNRRKTAGGFIWKYSREGCIC